MLPTTIMYRIHECESYLRHSMYSIQHLSFYGFVVSMNSFDVHHKSFRNLKSGVSRFVHIQFDGQEPLLYEWFGEQLAGCEGGGIASATWLHHNKPAQCGT